MDHFATVVTAWNILEPLLELCFAAVLAVASVILISRARRSWWRAGIAVVFASASFGVVRQFLNVRDRMGEAHRAINTASQLNSLNSLLVSLQIGDAHTRKQIDIDLIGTLRADGRTRDLDIRLNEEGMLRDYWKNPLFIEKRSDGYRILRSPGPDGIAETKDDL